jgi:hypothetical protein
MLSLQQSQVGKDFSGRSERCIQKESFANLEDGHPNGDGHIPNPMELLESPNSALQKFANQGGAATVGIKGQQGPPRPALN